MDVSLDIHRLQTRLENQLSIIRSSKEICEENKKAIFRFYSECVSQGLSAGRIAKLLHHIFQLAKIHKKPFKHATRDSIARVVQKIESNPDYSLWTKHDYKAILKKFFKWLRKSEDFPKEVKWIRSHFHDRNHTLPEELLTEDDIKKLVDAAEHPRDKALIFVLYESGCRIGELLTLRIKNVLFDEYGAVLLVNGKTGQRRIRIIASAPLLSAWLNTHPFRENPEAPLWLVIGARNHHGSLTYGSICSRIKRIARKAGLKKKVNPHAFRHARATHLANKLTEAQMKEYFGWVQSSDMASVYVHLSGRDVDNALLRLHGLQAKEDQKEEKLRVQACPRCDEKNSPVSRFCMRCGSPLSVETALELDEKRKTGNEVITQLVRDERIQEIIVKKALEDPSFLEKLRKML